ncbi:MAG: hypothetical protein IJ740_00095 [Ruminococcus sp.]|nr:hypothetical protein [Ruminococcus sp.]
MKKRVSFLVLFSAIIVVAVSIITVICARESAAEVYYIYNNVKVTGTRYTTENDRVELKNVSTSDNIVSASFVPKSIGSDTVTFYTETNEKKSGRKC